MGTCVRDRSGLRLHALPSSPRSRERHGGGVGGSELDFVRLAEALELTLLLVDGEPDKYERAAFRWHACFVQEVPNLELRESQAVLALLVAIPANRLAASALAELLSRRRSCERIAEALVRWSHSA
jgi:hypothetical protein